MRRVLLIALVLFSINAQAQLDWWNQTHNWDGTTPWTQYMKYSHAFLGPNAIAYSYPASHSDRSYCRSSSCTDEPSSERISFLSIGTTKLHWVRGHTQFHVHTSKRRSVLPHLQQTLRDLRASLEMRTADRRHSSWRRIVIDISTRSMGKRSWTAKYWYFTFPTLRPPLGLYLNATVYRCARVTPSSFHISGACIPSIGRWSPTITTDAGFQVYQTHWVDYPQNDGFLGNLRTSASEGRDQGCGVHARSKRSFTGYFQ